MRRAFGRPLWPPEVEGKRRRRALSGDEAEEVVIITYDLFSETLCQWIVRATDEAQCTRGRPIRWDLATLFSAARAPKSLVGSQPNCRLQTAILATRRLSLCVANAAC